MSEYISTEEAERIADDLDELRSDKAGNVLFTRRSVDALSDALRSLAAERDALDQALRKATWDLANFTFRGKDTSLGEEAERQYRAALGEEDR